MWSKAWNEEVWPVVKDSHEKLLAQRPCRQDAGAQGVHYGEKVVERLKENAELRHVCCNIAWTSPTKHSMDDVDFTVMQVERLAKRQFWDSERNCVSCPGQWFRNMNIPIKVFSCEEQPTKGEFLRYGLDLLVAAYWWAVWRATTDKHTPVLEALLKLGANVPFDFRHMRSEEEALLATTQCMEDHEALREYFGLNAGRLVQVVMDTRRLLRGKPDGKATPEGIAEYLRTNIRWADPKRTPTTATVSHLLTIGNMVARCPQAQELIVFGESHGGRESLFDEYSKLLLVVNKAVNPAHFLYLMEGLFVRAMLTENCKMSKTELSSKSGELNIWAFNFRYVDALLKKFPFHTADAEAAKLTSDLVSQLKTILASPCAWITSFPPPHNLATEACNQWVRLLPSWAVMLLTHVRDMYAGKYHMQLKGLLGSPPPAGVTSDTLMQKEPIKGVLDAIEKEYQTTQPSSEIVSLQIEDPSKGEVSPQEKPDSLEQLLKDASRKASETLSQKLIFLCPEGHDAVALGAVLQASELSVLKGRMLAFYDPKVAMQAKIYGNQSWYQRVPPLVVSHFTRFCRAVDAVLRDSKDMVCVLGGKLRSNDTEIIKVFNSLGWRFKIVLLVYCHRMMREQGHYKRQRGFANSSSTENLYIAWKGSFPSDFAKDRLYVDPTSNTWMDVMLNVPVCKKDELSVVSKDTKEKTVQAMSVEAIGTVPQEEAADESGASGDEVEKKRNYPKRNSGKALLRTHSTDEVLWFPHDIAPKLLQELMHESRAQYVFFGSPGGGSGILGALLCGAVSVAHTECQLHEVTLTHVLQQRLAEEFCTEKSSFADPLLTQRFAHLTKKTPAKSASHRRGQATRG